MPTRHSYYGHVLNHNWPENEQTPEDASSLHTSVIRETGDEAHPSCRRNFEWDRSLGRIVDVHSNLLVAHRVGQQAVEIKIISLCRGVEPRFRA